MKTFIVSGIVLVALQAYIHLADGRTIEAGSKDEAAQSRLKRSPEPGWSSGGYNSGYTSTSCYNCGGYSNNGHNGGYNTGYTTYSRPSYNSYSGGHNSGYNSYPSYNSGYNSYNSGGHHHGHGGGRRGGGGGGRPLRRLLRTKAVLGTGILLGAGLARGGGAFRFGK